jgi:2-polyprenyl-3-methyl-5-hydroxy-6-metoxy-1,4-benzoquinol methylase
MATGQLAARQIAGEWPPYFCTQHQAPLGPQLDCSGGHSIPTRDKIPRFADSAYTAHFGEQWNRYRLTQLDSYTGLPISRTRLERCLGPVQTRDRYVLECGCGAGRFTEVLLDEGALVTSIDLSSAVDANARTFPVDDRHRIAQADILALPFAPKQYDVVLCLGVIQHTPSPERTIAALYEQVRPGGWLIIDHYKPEWQWYTRTAPIFRAVLKRLDPATSMRVTERLTNLLLPVHKAVAHKPLLRRIWHRLSPLLTFYVLYPQLNDELQRQWALLDTHDSLTDYYKHFRSRTDIEGILKGLGAIEITAAEAGNGVEARCRRPTGPAA